MAIRVRTLKNGKTVRYDVVLRDPEGEQYTRTFTARAEAEKWERAELAARDQGRWIDPRGGQVTFKAWAEEWLANDQRKRPRTVWRDAQIVEKLLVPTFGHRKLATIKRVEVDRLVSAWAGRYKPNTVRRNYAVLHAIFAEAVAADLVGRSPCAAKLPAPTTTTPPKVTPDDLAALAAACGQHYEPVIWTAALLGLRWGEVAALRVGKIDFLRGEVTVDEAVVTSTGLGRVYGLPKSHAGTRTLAAPRALLDILAEHLVRQGATAADRDAFVFTMTAGTPLDYSNFRTRVLVPAVEAVGLDGLTFHGLRKIAATALVLEGVDLRTAMSRLGHSDPRLTLQVYAQFAGEADRQAADKVGDRLLAGRRARPTHTA